jgi:hypothetical protein
MSSICRQFARPTALNRRDFLRYLGSLPMLSLAACNAAPRCPLCGGRLVTVGAWIDDRSKPSVNGAVWNRASDYVGCEGCPEEFDSKSPLCLRCFHAFSERDQHWKRGCTEAVAFLRPLSSAIRGFPLPSQEFRRYGIYYTQTFSGRDGRAFYSDDVRYWYATSASKPTIEELNDYVNQHRMHLDYRSADKDGNAFLMATHSGSQDG